MATRAVCPSCHSKSLRLGLLPTIVTTIHHALCPHCNRKWSVEAKPMPTRFAGVFMHQLSYINISWR